MPNYSLSKLTEAFVKLSVRLYMYLTLNYAMDFHTVFTINWINSSRMYNWIIQASFIYRKDIATGRSYVVSAYHNLEALFIHISIIFQQPRLRQEHHIKPLFTTYKSPEYNFNQLQKKIRKGLCSNLYFFFYVLNIIVPWYYGSMVTKLRSDDGMPGKLRNPQIITYQVFHIFSKILQVFASDN